MKEDWEILNRNEDFLKGTMSSDEKQEFLHDLKQNDDLKQTLFVQSILTEKISNLDHLMLGNQLKNIHTKHYYYRWKGLLNKFLYGIIPLIITGGIVYFFNERSPESQQLQKESVIKNEWVNEEVRKQVTQPSRVEKRISRLAIADFLLNHPYTDTVVGENLVKNGDFTGIDRVPSGYRRAIDGYPITEGEYKITDHSTNPNTYFYPCGDHTTGNGMMMAVNGALKDNVPVWMGLISVKPNTDYEFSIWIVNVQNRNRNHLNRTDPTFTLRFNGEVVSAYDLPEEEGRWFEFKSRWNSGTNRKAAIMLTDTIIERFGNDFCLDDISFKEMKLSKDFVPGNVFFDYDKFALNESGQREADALASYMKANKNTTVIIKGLTDKVGGAGYNLKLSEGRAKAVADYLIEKGILKNRISYQGAGKEENTKLSDRESRRVQITIYK